MTVYKRDRLAHYRDLTTSYLANWTRAGWELASVLPFPYGGGNAEYLLFVVWRRDGSPPAGPDSGIPHLAVVPAGDPEANPAYIRSPDPQIPHGMLLCADLELLATEEARDANPAAIPA